MARLRTVEQYGTCRPGSLGYQCRHFANLRRDDRCGWQYVTDCFGRFESVPCNAEYNFVVGMKVPRVSQCDCTSERDPTRCFREHARRLGKQTDAGNERLVAHMLPAPTRLAHHLDCERTVGWGRSEEHTSEL